jgi:PAS domain S-box-containing protein
MAENFITLDLDTYESLQRELATLRQQVAEQRSDRDRDRDLLSRCQTQINLFLESIPVAIAMFDFNLHYLFASRRWQEIYGLENRNLSGYSLYESIPNLPQYWRDIHQRCLTGAVEKCDAIELIRPDGKTIWFAAQVNPWYDEWGQIGGLIILTEITSDRQKFDFQSRQKPPDSDSSLAQLLQDINNPINFIHGNLIHASEYAEDLLKIIRAYQVFYPYPVPILEELLEGLAFEFLVEDFPKLINSMQAATGRVKKTIAALQDVSGWD